MLAFFEDKFHTLVLLILVCVLAYVTLHHESQFWEGTLSSVLAALFLLINPRGPSSPNQSTEEKKQ